MRKFIKPFILGFLAGIILLGICVWFMMPKMMINVYESKFDFNETVSAVEEAVTNFDDWKTPKTFDIGQNVLEHDCQEEQNQDADRGYRGGHPAE